MKARSIIFVLLALFTTSAHVFAQMDVVRESAYSWTEMSFAGHYNLDVRSDFVTWVRDQYYDDHAALVSLLEMLDVESQGPSYLDPNYEVAMYQIGYHALADVYVLSLDNTLTIREWIDEHVQDSSPWLVQNESAVLMGKQDGLYVVETLTMFRGCSEIVWISALADSLTAAEDLIKMAASLKSNGCTIYANHAIA